MKIRTDFVTNSSSSSFIIAIHKDATEEDIKKELLTQQEYILSLINDYYCGCNDENYNFNSIINDVVNTIIRDSNGIEIENWIVGAERYYSDNSLEDYIIYCLGEINTDKFKLKGCD
jgi:hypothetical protein